MGPDGTIADFGLMCAGAATTTVYPPTIAGDVACIVANSGSRVVVGEDEAEADKLIEYRAEPPDVSRIVIIDDTGDGVWVLTTGSRSRDWRSLSANSPSRPAT